MVIHVLDSDFSEAMTALSGYGKVTNQQIQGKDVTNQVSSNAATIQILQDEVNLLQGKLAQATDINTFLQIQNQLFPVEQQLQQLQNQQTVLENSAALATITANLSAPGAPVVSTPRPRPNANSATMAWRYLRHNSLAVLDGLAVGGGWALPVLVLLGLAWLAGTRILRRRRQAINPA
jgi:TolA-binding protein